MCGETQTGAVSESGHFLALRDVKDGNIGALDPQKRDEVMKIADSIKMESSCILGLGSSARKNLSSYSTEVLKSVKRNDTPAVDEMLSELMAQMEPLKPSAVDSALRKGGFLDRIFRVEKIKNFLGQYETIAQAIDSVKARMSEAEIELNKDIVQFSEFEKQNIAYIENLDMYIIAGNVKLKEAKEELAEKQKLVSESPSDTLLAGEVADFENEVIQLERKLYSLLEMRELSAQNIPKVRLLKEADAVAVTKIQNAVDSIIPMWESEFLIAVGIDRLNKGLKMNRAAKEMTGKLASMNTDTLRACAVEVQRQLDEGIVDPQVIVSNNQKLIDMTADIKKTREDGARVRAECIEQIASLQESLNTALIPGGTDSKKF